VHIQGAGGHFLPEEAGGELLEAPVRGGVGSYKGQTAGEGTEKADTDQQLGKGERGTFTHDDYLITESVGKSICGDFAG